MHALTMLNVPIRTTPKTPVKRTRTHITMQILTLLEICDYNNNMYLGNHQVMATRVTVQYDNGNRKAGSVIFALASLLGPPIGLYTYLYDDAPVERY